LISSFSDNSQRKVRVFTMDRGTELGSALTLRNAPPHWLPNQRAIAVMDERHWGRWRIFDFPIRKSLTWFAAGAAFLAFPIALIARRRVRNLRAA
jgi:hypothetical protein